MGNQETQEAETQEAETQEAETQEAETQEAETQPNSEAVAIAEIEANATVAIAAIEADTRAAEIAAQLELNKELEACRELVNSQEQELMMLRGRVRELETQLTPPPSQETMQVLPETQTEILSPMQMEVTEKSEDEKPEPETVIIRAKRFRKI